MVKKSFKQKLANKFWMSMKMVLLSNGLLTLLQVSCFLLQPTLKNSVTYTKIKKKGG